MSSPQINNLILAGCILSYTSVLLMGIDSTLLGKRSSESAMNFICAVSSSHWTTLSLSLIDHQGSRVDVVHRLHHLLRRHIQQDMACTYHIHQRQRFETSNRTAIAFAALLTLVSLGSERLPFVHHRRRSLRRRHRSPRLVADSRSAQNLQGHQSAAGRTSSAVHSHASVLHA